MAKFDVCVCVSVRRQNGPRNRRNRGNDEERSPLPAATRVARWRVQLFFREAHNQVTPVQSRPP